MNTISRTLALLKPANLVPAWKWIDLMEEYGEIEADEERQWKEMNCRCPQIGSIVAVAAD